MFLHHDMLQWRHWFVLQYTTNQTTSSQNEQIHELKLLVEAAALLSNVHSLIETWLCMHYVTCYICLYTSCHWRAPPPAAGHWRRCWSTRTGRPAAGWMPGVSGTRRCSGRSRGCWPGGRRPPTLSHRCASSQYHTSDTAAGPDADRERRGRVTVTGGKGWRSAAGGRIYMTMDSLLICS